MAEKKKKLQMETELWGVSNGWVVQENGYCPGKFGHVSADLGWHVQ